MLAQQIDRQKPRLQRQFGLGEEGSCSEGHLMFAAIVLQQIPGTEPTVAATTAGDALESVWPALLEHEFSALGLSAEAVEERG